MNRFFHLGIAGIAAGLLLPAVGAVAQSSDPRVDALRELRSGLPGGRGTPPGWDQGNREGWRGGEVPPGHQRRDDVRWGLDRGTYRGEVIRTRNSNTVEVRLQGERDTRTIQLERGGQVRANGRTIRMEDLRRGDPITIRVTRPQNNRGTIQVQSIEVHRQTWGNQPWGNQWVQAEVVREARRGTDTIEVRIDRQTRTVRLDRGGRVTVNGRTIRLDELRRRDTIRFRESRSSSGGGVILASTIELLNRTR
jgi:hypothetical protein